MIVPKIELSAESSRVYHESGQLGKKNLLLLININIGIVDDKRLDFFLTQFDFGWVILQCSYYLIGIFSDHE